MPQMTVVKDYNEKEKFWLLYTAVHQFLLFYTVINLLTHFRDHIADC